MIRAKAKIFVGVSVIIMRDMKVIYNSDTDICLEKHQNTITMTLNNFKEPTTRLIFV